MAFTKTGGGEEVETKVIQDGSDVSVYRRKVVVEYWRQISVAAAGEFTPLTPTQIYGGENLRRCTDYRWELDEITRAVTEYKTFSTPGLWYLADTYEADAAPID